MHTWYMGRRWYTSDFQTVTADIWAFVSPWQQCRGLHPGIEEVFVKCL